jgi:hypothetical protein
LLCSIHPTLTYLYWIDMFSFLRFVQSGAWIRRMVGLRWCTIGLRMRTSRPRASKTRPIVAQGEHTIKETKPSLSTRRTWYIYGTTSYLSSCAIFSA